MLKSNSREMELYLHLPFCVKKCDYCDFLSGPVYLRRKAEYLEALVQEIRGVGKLEEQEGWQVQSVFFGGGTPSLLTGDEMRSLLEEVRNSFLLSSSAEISMEANPGTLSSEKLRAYAAAGINRLSLGCQSLKDEELKSLGRIHTREEFLEAFHMAREAGFENINVDLISGLPKQSVSDWEENLRETAVLAPEHISAYSLIVEEGTPFYERELKLPDEDSERRMYEMTAGILGEYGYRQYEISNYAKKGKECLHNVGYWRRVPYRGLGLGASSLWNDRRYCNTSVMDEYLSGVQEILTLRREEEELTQQEQMEEFLFLGLRMTEGISQEEFRRSFGISVETVFGNAIKKHEGLGLLVTEDGRIRLTQKGISLSNQVFVDFLE